MKRSATLFVGLLHAGLAFAQAATPAQDALAQRLAPSEQRLSDWAELARYRDENARLPAPEDGEARVVFMGDSITDFRGRSAGVFFPGKPYVNRGISGQTTPQMLIRFRADVIALKPRVVVTMAIARPGTAHRAPPMTMDYGWFFSCSRSHALPYRSSNTATVP